jgi:hypothetical protein
MHEDDIQHSGAEQSTDERRERDGDRDGEEQNERDGAIPRSLEEGHWRLA